MLCMAVISDPVWAGIVHYPNVIRPVKNVTYNLAVMENQQSVQS